MMESKIPLPTDNIYKFYALFGILLLVTSIVAFAYTNQSTNTLLFNNFIALEELKLKENPSPLDGKRQAVLQRQRDIAISDRNFFNAVIGGLVAVAAVAMWFGFGRWHNVVQPKQDRLLDLPIHKAVQYLTPPGRSPFRGPK